ncbi:LOW QUALITY PROTEIN: uncharacterized protein Hap1MRO34_004786 [Clarias gariepinus]
MILKVTDGSSNADGVLRRFRQDVPSAPGSAAWHSSCSDHMQKEQQKNRVQWQRHLKYLFAFRPQQYTKSCKVNLSITGLITSMSLNDCDSTVDKGSISSTMYAAMPLLNCRSGSAEDTVTNTAPFWVTWLQKFWKDDSLVEIKIQFLGLIDFGLLHAVKKAFGTNPGFHWQTLNTQEQICQWAMTSQQPHTEHITMGEDRFELLALKWLPMLSWQQAQELSPFKVIERRWHNSMVELVPSPALVCAVRRLQALTDTCVCVCLRSDPVDSLKQQQGYRIANSAKDKLFQSLMENSIRTGCSVRSALCQTTCLLVMPPCVLQLRRPPLYLDMLSSGCRVVPGRLCSLNQHQINHFSLLLMHNSDKAQNVRPYPSQCKYHDLDVTS